MRRRFMFVAGVAVGLAAGARIGRERYDQVVISIRKVTDSPAVRKTARTVTQKAGEFTRTTAQQAADKLPRPRLNRDHEPEQASVNGAQPPA